MCELLVGLGEVTVLGVDRVAPDELVVLIEPRLERPDCTRCGRGAWVKDRPEVPLVDLPCFDATTVLVVRKIRWWCPNQRCGVGSWTTPLPHIIAAGRQRLTDRAARWATAQVGRYGRSVHEVAEQLNCDWHTVNDAVLAYGEALVDDDADRIGVVRALSLDETLFMREGAWRTQRWSTQLVDARSGQLLDVVPGRTAAAPAAWLAARDQRWRARIRWGVLDLSGPYRATFDTMLPEAVQVADPFHVVKHANSKLDECRRRVQNEVLGHRGRKHDPLYRARRLLVKAHERLDHRGNTKLQGLLAAGDPRGEVAYAWHAIGSGPIPL
jgi:transposase